MNALAAKSNPPAAKVETVSPATVAAAYLRAADVIQLLPISRRTLGNWTRKRVLPFHRVGKVILFRRADVEQALERFRVAAVGERRAS
jgi:excisionase family DNA binding protein